MKAIAAAFVAAVVLYAVDSQYNDGRYAQVLARISHTIFALSGRIARWQVGFLGMCRLVASGGRERSLGFCWAAGGSEGLVSVGLG